MAEARQILHVDMDAFYAAIEQRDDPALRGKPVIVGGRSPRAVVCTASYEARPHGVRSAMPMGEATRRCPQGLVIPPRMGRYAEVSEQVMGVLKRFSPLVEPISLDEAFLDVTASRALFGDGTAIARRIRAEIREETGLTASAGVATSKFVAKVASDLHKPDGLTVVEPGSEQRFLAPLPIERMWGVGPKTAARLRQLGLARISDLATSSPEALSRAMGSSWGEYVLELARGIDPRPVVPRRDPVSLGAEDTFEHDLTRTEDLERAILRQAARVASRLATQRLVCRAVTLKVKLHDHTLITRRTTLPAAAQDTVTLHQAACALLARVELAGRGVRLTGVQASGLVREREEQRPLFGDEHGERRRRLERALAGVRSRFGDEAVVQAGTLSDRRAPHGALGPKPPSK